MRFKVDSVYRWPMSEDEHSGFDTKPSLWFTVTKELSDDEVEIVWCDGEVDSMPHSSLKFIYVPEVRAIGEYE